MFPKSSTFLFVTLPLFLAFVITNYLLLQKNLKDNHLKNQEITFLYIQQKSSILLSKLLFSYGKEKDFLVQKHLEVEKYLENKPLNTNLDEIYTKINQGFENKPYNIYITNDDLVIKNSTMEADLDFDLSFAKSLFDSHKTSGIIGISFPVFEMYNQKFLSYSDRYIKNTNSILQVSFTYDSLNNELEDMKNILNKNNHIIASNAYLIFEDGYVGDFLFKNIKPYKQNLKEIEQRIQNGKELYNNFQNDNNIVIYENELITNLLFLEKSPVYNGAKIIYSIIFDNSEINYYTKILNISFITIICVGFLTILILFRIRKKEYILSYKDKFIEHSIHEIKTPLSIINLNIQLKDEILGEDKYSKKIKAALLTLKNSYDDMTFLHIKSKINYKIETLNLEEILKDRVAYFDIVAKTQGRFLKLIIKDSFNIKISRIEIERLIDNNISNAIKYSEVNSIIKIILENQTLKFISNSNKIIDTKKIFNRYEREDLSTGGHGLGLSIVKDICDKYKININVISKKNLVIFIYNFNCHTIITSKV